MNLISQFRRIKDKYGHYVCILYRSKPDGSVDRDMYFKRMLLESVHASLQDFYSNEFSPADWWGEGTSLCRWMLKRYPKILRSLKTHLLQTH